MANTTTTSGGTVTSFSNTPQAKDDTFSGTLITEDFFGTIFLDVMANDLGGKAKILYSLDNGFNQAGDPSSVDLLTKDALDTDTNIGVVDIEVS